MNDSRAWRQIWKASGVSDTLAPPSKHLEDQVDKTRVRVGQTVVLHVNTHEAKQRAEATMRRAGFDRADYDLLATVDARSLVAHEETGAEELRPDDSRLLKQPARSEWLRLLLSSQALLALQTGKETPYDVDSLDAVGEFLTHIAVWKHIVKYRVPYTLIIDGATFDSPHEDVPDRVDRLLSEAEFVRPAAHTDETSTPNNALPAFDALFLSYRQAFGAGGARFVADRIPGADSLVQYGAAGCMLLETSAYLVSLDGAQKLLDRALPIETRLAPFMFMLAKIDNSNFRALLAQPPLASHNYRGENVSIDSLAFMMSRKQLVVGMATLALLCVLSILFFIVVYVRSRRQSPIDDASSQSTRDADAANRNTKRRTRPRRRK